MNNFNYILNAVSFAEENNSLKSVQTVANSFTQTAMGIAMIIVSSITGLVVLFSIIWFIIQFLKYKFATNNQRKSEIWEIIKKSFYTLLTIIVVLMVASAIMGAIVNITNNSLSGIQQAINPGSSAPSVGGPSASSPGA